MLHDSGLGPHDSWLMTDDSRLITHASRLMAPWGWGVPQRPMSHEPWAMSHGSWIMSDEAWVMSLESWIMIHKAPSASIQEFNDTISEHIPCKSQASKSVQLTFLKKWTTFGNLAYQHYLFKTIFLLEKKTRTTWKVSQTLTAVRGKSPKRTGIQFKSLVARHSTFQQKPAIVKVTNGRPAAGPEKGPKPRHKSRET